jgi:hypothetical protein
MKKSALPAALLLMATGLSGCPIYDDHDSGCYRDSDCASGYQCDRDTGDCYPEDDGGTACRKPSDCGTNETCSRSGTCMTGDCHFSTVGCVRGYTCSSTSGRWECVDDSPSAGGSTSSDGGAPTSAAGQAGESSQSGAPSGGGG